MIDLTTLEQASDAALLEVAQRWGNAATALAKRKAPVRKVFEGSGAVERIRLKSIEEIETDRSLRRRLGLGPEYGPLNTKGIAPATTLTHFAPQELGQRRIAGPGRLKLPSAQERLDRRGRYDLKTMRAAHQGQLGGRLREEIFSTQARIYGHRVTVKVVSPTEYAKYQELGTRHNPAHPYLRPAAHETVEGVRADLKKTMPGVIRGRLHATIPVVIRI